MTALVGVEVRGAAAVVTLRRDDKLNALSTALEGALSDAMGRPQRPKGQSRAPTKACSIPQTVMLRRQGEPLSSGGRRSTPPTGKR